MNKRYQSLLFLVLFLGYFSGTTLFYHAHTDNDHRIVHSHPFSHSKEGEPLHGHPFDDFVGIQEITGFISTIPLPFISMKIFHFLIFERRAVLVEPDLTGGIIHKITLRGPPVQ